MTRINLSSPTRMVASTLIVAPALMALMALVAFAGDPPAERSVEQLIAQLGADEYQAREDATKALIARGAAAIPALEKAVQAEDVEVRMRAGRALRTIREKQPRKIEGPRNNGSAPSPTSSPTSGGSGVEHRSTSMRFVNGVWEVTITRGVGAEKTTKVFKGTSIEELKKKHPEVREALGQSTFRIGGASSGGDPFKQFDNWDFDKWFGGFGGRRGRDPFGGADDLNAEIERLRLWARWLAAQRMQRTQRNRGGGAVDPRLRKRQDAEALLLGIRVRKPETVLDAQLQLRGRGLVVETVGLGTLAARLGLQRFDILLELNGLTVRTAADIRPALLSRNPKQPVTVKVMRHAKLVALEETAAPVGPKNRAEPKDK